MLNGADSTCLTELLFGCARPSGSAWFKSGRGHLKLHQAGQVLASQTFTERAF